MRYWFDMGVDGMRLDAIPYLCERDGTINENLPETHAVLQHMRARARPSLSRSLLPRRGQPVAGGRARVLRQRRRMPHGVPLSTDAADLHGGGRGGPLSDRRHHGADARHPGQLPVGDLPAQPRRADARDGDRARARLHVSNVRQRAADAHQSRHPPQACAADGQQPAQDRAGEQPADVADRIAGDLLRRRDRHGRQHLSSAIATACARRCSGARTATRASRAPTRSSCICRRSWTRSTAMRRSTSRRRAAARHRCSTGPSD